MDKTEKKPGPEIKPPVTAVGQELHEDYIPVEEISYSFLWFLMSGALLAVTVWAFWDDEYARRGYKQFQEAFFETEFNRAKDEWKKNEGEISAKVFEIKRSLEQESGELENSSEFEELAEKVLEAKIKLEETVELRKFAGSRMDEAYYWFKKAQHEGKSFTVQKAEYLNAQKEVANYDPIVEGLEKNHVTLENQLLEIKVKQVSLEKELVKLTRKRDSLERTMDFYKPFPFFLKPAAIEQTVIPGARLNKFKEITYKVDRCMTCHYTYKDKNYEKGTEPLKTHPNLPIYIEKHPVEQTGCTWCHKGQGSATAPAEHAHGSHHEMDQSLGINEPIVEGDFMQSQCRNCHDEVLRLEGAPELSRGKNLFLKLGCHGCHLAEGFQSAEKVGPRLLRLGSKVNPSWLYRWVKNPKGYLPKTRMPNFGFNDKDALAVVAYLTKVSDPKYKPLLKYNGGNPEKGQKLFESIGCLACHEANGKGEVFGPDLTRIGEKVNSNWLVSWIHNPKHYNNRSLMPSLRVEVKDASDIAAYLLQFSKPKPIRGIEQRIALPQLVTYGKTVVRRRGCFACHDIKGMEKEGRIAPELSSFGAKQTWELEYGDTHVPHTWEAWATNKLRNPSTFRTERVLDKMPNFGLAEEEIHSLLVLLKGYNGLNIPPDYQRSLNDDEKVLEKGRRIIVKYNCRGCHNVEGEGGVIQKYIKNKNNYPPPLENGSYHVGERIKASWLYSFLKSPTPVRTWLKVRMPTFSFTDQEVSDLTAYFEALVPGEVGYEAGVHLEKDQSVIDMGVKMINYMECGNCHDDGVKGIDFSIASQRLRQRWIPKWLKDTRELLPMTRMPVHWEKKEGKYVPASKFDQLNEVLGGDVELQAGVIRDFLVAYNNAEIDFELSFDESGDDEEDENGDEEDGDEEDG